MKKSYIKLSILLALMFLGIIYSIFFYNIFENNTTYCIFISLMFFVSFILVKFEREEKTKKLDVFRKVFVYTAGYLMLIYISGFMFGFVKSPYSLEISKLLPIAIPLLLIAVFEEMLRFNMIKKMEKRKGFIVLTTIMFIAINTVGVLNLYSFKTGMDVYEFIGVLIVPTIAKNILFSYIAYNGYYKVNIIYRVFINILIYFLPIYPNLGIYLESILNIVLPTFIYLSVNSIFSDQRLIFRREVKYKNLLFILPAFGVLAVSVILTSGAFKYYAISVASASMSPSIKTGDAVVVKKVDANDIKEGQVLVHKHDGRIILHRVVSVKDKKEEVCYYTKGDANPTEDGYEICKKDIYGIVVFKVPFIGWPSVFLERLTKN